MLSGPQARPNLTASGVVHRARLPIESLCLDPRSETAALLAHTELARRFEDGREERRRA